jgi:hypothetical protein
MKKSLLILTILICVRTTLFAPIWEHISLLAGKSINPYKELVKAVCKLESDNGKCIYNPVENAVGQFQIRQIRVDDYNQRTGNNYKLEDFYDYNLSEKMFLYYASGKSYEKAAKNWNGSGSLTISYWNNIKKLLPSNYLSFNK